MRPIEFQPATTVPASTTLTAGVGTPAPAVLLTWTDTTPFNYATGLPASTLGNPANEVGFTVQRATNSSFSQGLQSFTARANRTSLTDATTSRTPGTTTGCRPS